MKAWSVIASLAAAVVGASHALSADDQAARWRHEAATVTIVRDDWGIAHVTGATDANAVFGAAYAQAEDDFNRIETNYITALGRSAEVEGERALYRDLRRRLFINPADLKGKYASSPTWLQALMDAWADGLNWYLATHPAVKPKLITRFEPWMTLAFSEGSIDGDIERVSLARLRDFYGAQGPAVADPRSDRQDTLPSGSNGIAIAPANTRDGHALLLINPHTLFFFRSELQMTSGQGLNAYGAATWGQFFIYQGFNATAGWMHTSSGVDAVDEFAETIIRKNGALYYRYGQEERPVNVSKIAIACRTDEGGQGVRTFTVYRTHHGPIVRATDGKWIAVALMQRPVEALSQSFLRTKAADYASFLKVARLHANSSNNTIFADAKGDIAYLHPQFIPRRDDRFDYSAPVDGADPATDWKGVHTLEEAPHVLNPAGGWVFNTNDWPYSAAGKDSPRQVDYPRYMDEAGENPRGVHAVRLLEERRDFTLQSLIAAAYDPYLPEFAKLVPTLTGAYDRLDASDPLKAALREQVTVLRGWDDRWSADSVATSLAVYWGETLWSAAGPPAAIEGVSKYAYIESRDSDRQRLEALAEASDRLKQDFGTWRTPWGQINRFQRRSDDIAPHFDDQAPSLAVPFTSSRWGSLAAFETAPDSGTKRRYGVSGNSFVAAVEFGPRVRALAVSIGGESGDPASPHFDDQSARYAKGDLRKVYFYPDELKGHTVRAYHPGSEE
jgi:acyl-homoserine-lactone acylase